MRMLGNMVFNGIIMGLSIALLWHFSNIWRYGQYLVGEPNIVIRSLETAGLLLILVLGACKCVKDIREAKRKTERQER